MATNKAKFDTVENKEEIFRSLLDSTKNRYGYIGETLASKVFNFRSVNEQLVVWVKDQVALPSDCYLMSFICQNAFVSLKALANYYIAEAKRDSGQNELLLRETNRKSLEELLDFRLANLVRGGFLLRYNYEFDNNGKSQNGVFYSATRDTAELVTRTLSKDVYFSAWDCVYPLHKMIGVGAASHISSFVSASSTFERFGKNVHKFSLSGRVRYADEQVHEIDVNGQNVHLYVGFTFAYFIKTSIVSDVDFKKDCRKKITEIVEYLKYRCAHKDNCVTYMVCAVEDMDDLERLYVYLRDNRYVDENLIKRLYITSAGVMQSIGSFIRFYDIESSEMKFRVEEPPFAKINFDGLE